ncbi:MAG TPA: nicotinate-nucleotide--dimethylbenzimidazole phosphoribosyltransferase [Acidobacteriota bacterium]
MSVRLAVRGLSAGYPGRDVLRDIDLEVEGGEILGVLGANGSGKTTLLRCLAAQLAPRAGSVTVDGSPLRGMGPRQLARRLAVVPQQYELPAGFTVAELVEMGRNPYLGHLGRATAADEAAVEGALAALGVAALRRRQVQELSGGERQMTVLAMALAQQPGLLLLDEPTSHLDFRHQTRSMEAIRDLADREGLAVIAVLHDLGLAARHCDRVALLRSGELLACGPPEQLLTAALLRACYGVTPAFLDAAVFTAAEPGEGGGLRVRGGAPAAAARCGGRPPAAWRRPRHSLSREDAITTERPQVGRARDGRGPRAAFTDMAATVLAGLEIPAIDAEARRIARRRQQQLLKPPGSLGRLETLAVELAGMTGGDLDRLQRVAFLVFAADHGVAARGVSAYPAEVTGQMVRSFLRGWAAISVLARADGADLRVVDVGIGPPLDALLAGCSTEMLVRARVRSGSRDLTREPALRPDEVAEAIAVGRAQLAAAAGRGAGIVGLGEMGIGNTTAAAAVVAAILGSEAAAVTGPGTGIDAAKVAAKAELIAAALRLHAPDPTDPLDVLAKVGGLEIAALTGAILEGAARRIPIVLDGFITAAAALAAVALAPRCADYLIASHRSPEPGHDLALARLGLRPLLDLGLRLGEASGAAVAMPVIRAAARLHVEMATFEQAGVSGVSP